MNNNAVRNFSKDVTIINELGLHARSAAQIAQIAKHATSKVWVIRDDETVDAESVIDILTLACGKGSIVTIKVDSPMDINILNDIVQLVESGFGE